MALAKSLSISLFGLQGRLIEVEADISSNLPGFVLVGLPDASLQEASARVRAACVNTGLPWPARKITVNLSPASVPKAGSGFDLSIAASIMAANGLFSQDALAGTVLLGELTLDGAVRGIRGVLPSIQAAKKLGVAKFIVPRANLPEAKLVEGVEVIGISDLAEFAGLFGVSSELKVPSPPVETPQLVADPTAEFEQKDILDVLGQESAVYALAVAAVGGHHTLLVGPPGSGKTMLAERLPGLLPELDVESALELAAVNSLLSSNSEFDRKVPFVAPHHGVSATALVGGGSSVPRPGLISQAHGGVLFLDEAPEFAPASLEALREPLESGQISVSRASGTASFPARFQLLLAANPCPCGNRGTRGKDCSCTVQQRNRYASRLSGPLLDRFDIRLRVHQATKTAKAASAKDSDRLSSSEWRGRILEARVRTHDRLASSPWRLNSEVSGAYLRRLNRENPSAVRVLDAALAKGTLSMRGYDRCLRVAWSIADLEGLERLSASVVGQALFLRGLEGWAGE
ncbi:MAG: YifB family Mg chelatase-like AAA ATPase [Micrococcales bacterium]